MKANLSQIYWHDCSCMRLVHIEPDWQGV